jgi:hypothetical protein
MQVLNIIVPILVRTMDSDSAAIRTGVCLAIQEILEGMTHDQLPAIMPAIQRALCDSDGSVRHAAGTAFAALFRGGAGSMVEGMLPALLDGLAVEETAEQSIKGLEVILGVRPALLDRVLAKLLKLPLVAHNVRAAGPLLGQASGHLVQHLAFALPRLLSLPASQRGDAALRVACHSAAAAAASAAADPADVSELVRCLLRHLECGASRGTAAAVLREWVGVTSADIDLHKPILISSLVELFGEALPEDEGALEKVWAAAKAVLGTVDKAELPGFVATVRKALSTAHDVARRNTEPGEAIEIPGCALHCCCQESHQASLFLCSGFDGPGLVWPSPEQCAQEVQDVHPSAH